MGNVQFKDGKVLFTASGVAMDPACCCGCDPCTTCGGSQGTVTLDMDSLYGRGPGSMTFDSFGTSGDDCYWIWTATDGVGTAWTLTLTLDTTSQTWTLELTSSTGEYWIASPDPLPFNAAACDCDTGGMSFSLPMYNTDNLLEIISAVLS